MRGYAVGAVDYLVKPVVPEFVRSKVAVFVELARKSELLQRQAELLQASEQDARDLAETRAELVRDLEHKNRELESFSYAVSHDLRAPLRRIESFSRAVQESQGERMDADGRRYLDRVREASRQMSQLIDDVLHLARVTGAEMREQEVDLSGLVALLLDRMREAEPERRVEVRIRPGLTVTADGQLLRIALENLLENAWKFTAREPVARLEFGMTNIGGRAGVLRSRQRGGLRHGLRRPAVRPVPAAAPRERVPRQRDRARHRAADHPPARRPGLGRGHGGPGRHLPLHDRSDSGVTGGE